MAFVAVTSLMRSLEFQFLHPQPRLTLPNKKQIESLHEKLGDLLVFLDNFEKNADNLPEMRAVIEEIIDVSVKADDGIEEELLTASFSSTKLEETLQRVVDEVEKLVQIAMNATELVNSNNLTVGGSSSQHTSHEYTSDLFHSNVGVVHVKDAMIGHSEELNMCGTEWYLQATSFKKLRVLDLSKIVFKSGVPRDITDLVFLSEGDDKDAHKLLPHGIWDNLQQLRHLEINSKLQVSIDLLKVQEYLQTLYWLSISQCTAEVFMKIPNVKELGIVAGGHDEVSPQGLNNLCYLNYLKKLRVEGSDDHPLHLPRQPWSDIFPQNLKALTFVSTRIPWSEMSIISMLPKLEVLKLKNFACTGQEWELTEDDGLFPRLKVLIICLTDLKLWMADVDSFFPKLKRLKLKKCFELKEMPYWIEYIITLQLIKLVYCSASLVRSANKIKEERLDWYEDDMLDVLDFHTRPAICDMIAYLVIREVVFKLGCQVVFLFLRALAMRARLRGFSRSIHRSDREAGRGQGQL
nr:putative late blight resistance protein homolog R1B-17 [Ipomoea trifida]